MEGPKWSWRSGNPSHKCATKQKTRSTCATRLTEQCSDPCTVWAKSRWKLPVCFFHRSPSATCLMVCFPSMMTPKASVGSWRVLPRCIRKHQNRYNVNCLWNESVVRKHRNQGTPEQTGVKWNMQSTFSSQETWYDPMVMVILGGVIWCKSVLRDRCRTKTPCSYQCKHSTRLRLFSRSTLWPIAN